ncbi:unnamed protein product, partial [Hapterophycus canaliculatus]
DFSCADLGGGGGPETPQQQQFSFSPKVSGRKRSFTQACNWDNLGPKALSEISAGLLAGGWENAAITPQFSVAASSAVPSPRAESFPTGAATDAAAAAPATSCFSPGRDFVGRTSVSVSVSAPGAKYKRPSATIGSSGAAADSRKGLGPRCASKARRGGTLAVVAGAGAAGGGKKPLNPDRMERKASREKRRREEVNEKFEQLLQVLDDAEATSGLEPDNAEEGKPGTANACINGRRVEVLSRTIKILKKLLEDKRNAISGGPTSATSGLCGGDGGGDGGEEEEEEEGPVLHSLLERKLIQEEKPPLLAGSAATAAAAGAGASPSGVPDGLGAKAPALVAAGSTSVSGAKTANPSPTLVHHMTMPVPGHHHAPIMMPPGFPGMSAPHSMPSHPGQPIFIAVPMYMPQGQGMGPPTPSLGTAAESTVGQASPAGHSSSNLPGPAAADATATAEAALGATVESMKRAMAAPLTKEGWAIPAGMGYPSMTTLQMPQFVTQALSSEEGDEPPTHAVCA